MSEVPAMKSICVLRAATSGSNPLRRQPSPMFRLNRWLCLQPEQLN
jgi:hypothetical protein